MEQLLIFCRPGFEREAGQEITDAAAGVGIFGYFEPALRQGYLQFHLPGPEGAMDLLRRLPLESLVFVRDWFALLADVTLPKEDRVGAVIEALRDVSDDLVPCARIEVRLPEDNSDADLGKFARKWVSPLSKGLRGAGVLGPDPDKLTDGRLEVLLPTFERAFVGYSLSGNRARYVSGIPRLRLPAAAPSRSALKLDEAWKVFIPEDQMLAYLGGGKKAVDLGAAPGGWTWQLVRQGMMVSAVDNGPMNEALMASGHVEHVMADGYQWQPRRPVDWMVCDIVDQPRKTAKLAADWLVGRLCRYTVFNLKLPMKKRYEEWLECRALLEDRLDQAGIKYHLMARHLYHDREEITCFVERLD